MHHAVSLQCMLLCVCLNLNALLHSVPFVCVCVCVCVCVEGGGGGGAARSVCSISQPASLLRINSYNCIVIS